MTKFAYVICYLTQHNNLPLNLPHPPLSLNNILFKYKVQALQTREHAYIVSIHLKGIQK